MVVYLCRCHSLNRSHSLLPLLGPQFHSPHVHLYFLLYNILEVTKLQKCCQGRQALKGQDGLVNKWVWQKQKMATRGIPELIERFCILMASMSITCLWYWTLVVPDVSMGENWVKSTLIISYNCTWIYDCLKIKCLIVKRKGKPTFWIHSDSSGIKFIKIFITSALQKTSLRKGKRKPQTGGNLCNVCIRQRTSTHNI